MHYMSTVVFKGFFDDRYSNSATCIAFGMQDTVINVEESY